MEDIEWPYPPLQRGIGIKQVKTFFIFQFCRQFIFTDLYYLYSGL